MEKRRENYWHYEQAPTLQEQLSLIRELRWAVLHLGNTGDGGDLRIVRALRRADRVLGLKVKRPKLVTGQRVDAIEAVLRAGRLKK